MISDNIKKWFDKDEAEEIIDEITTPPVVETEPEVVDEPEKPKTYSFM